MVFFAHVNTKETVFILAPTNEGDATLHCIQPMHVNEAAATTATTADEEAA